MAIELNQPSVNVSLLILPGKIIPGYDTHNHRDQFCNNKFLYQILNEGFCVFPIMAYFANFYNTRQLLLPIICTLRLLFFKFKSYLSP